MAINIGSNPVDSIVTKDIIIDYNFSIPKWIELGNTLNVSAINIEGLGNPEDNNYTIKGNSIIIKRFKPNMWLVRDPQVLSGNNNCKAVCDRARNTRITVRGLNDNASIFNSFYKEETTTGGNRDQLQMKGFCFYPYITGGNAGSRILMFFSSLTYWSNTIYRKDGTSESMDLCDVVYEGGWRFDGGNHDQRGIFHDCEDRLVFPDEIIGWTNFNGASYYWGFGLYTGNESVVDENGYIDVSDNPIEVSIIPEGSDMSSSEIWDINLGEEPIYNKNKTIQNCLLKYGYAFPTGFAYNKQSLSYEVGKIKWISPTKFIVTHINSDEPIILQTPQITLANTVYANIGFNYFKIKVYNKPANVNISVERNITGSITDSYSLQNSLQTELTLNADSKLVYYDSSNKTEGTLQYIDMKLAISSSINQDLNLVFEIVPQNSSVYSLNTNYWHKNAKLTIPIPVDLSDGYSNGTYNSNLDTIKKFRWNCNPYNTEFWDIVTDYFDNNVAPTFGDYIFANCVGLDSIKIKLSQWPQHYGSYGFVNSSIKSVTFDSNTLSSNTHNVDSSIDEEKGGLISSANHIFSRAPNLEQINIVLKQGQDYLMRANDFAGAFEYCSITTYPERMINWTTYSNVFQETIPCTLMSYAFDYCGQLTQIPSYPGDEEENTIVPARYAERMFGHCSSLQTINPNINMILADPLKSNYIFYGCSSLQTVKLYNLNHGDWYFDGVSRTINGTQYCHGNFTSLDQESYQILVNNLADLTTHNSLVHENTIDKSFKNWSSGYKEALLTNPNPSFYFDSIRSFYAKGRSSSLSAAPMIVSTDQELTDMVIAVKNMQSDDVLVFCTQSEQSVTEDNVIELDEEGKAIVNNTQGTVRGFKLIGNSSNTTPVHVIIENGLDYSNPNVSSANLYLPSVASNYITDSMIQEANAKGWSVNILN